MIKNMNKGLAYFNHLCKTQIACFFTGFGRVVKTPG